ncbi:sensor domain-containing diguanylate cyclase [Vibrio brasiliensis]|uniref:diguanylate cyclase n=1 Tax=Vibrio brasiliensis TaxID=170652 RepID=UPI001EFC526C|nr:sensor domain-containing diguanylate cyclase [Vibrio brasiliensis]
MTNAPRKLCSKLSINQMLVLSHVLLVMILISGFSYTRYHSEWNRHVEYSASLAKLTLAPHVPYISTAVAGINYSNLLSPSTEKLLSSIDDLEFLEVSGQSDYSAQSVHIRFFKRFEYLWRADVEQDDVAKLEQKLAEMDDSLQETAADNSLRRKKLMFIQGRLQREYDSLVNSLSIESDLYMPWNKPARLEDGYYLDEELCTLNVVVPLSNSNGGEIWAVFDASELTNLQRSLVEEIVAEAIVALAISLVLIGWVSHWIVSPLKSLAAHMRSDTTQGNIAHFNELERSDEIGQLARAYHSLLIKLDNQLSILRARSDTDPLTGLGSRYKYSRTAIPFIKRQFSLGNHVALLVCDVDNFKAFNDIYGHTAGDNALSQIGALFNKLAREGDLVFRYGGEEIVILVGRPDREQLIQHGERLIKAVEALDITHLGNQPYGRVTASIGGAIASEQELKQQHESYQAMQSSLFNLADKALYISKQKGRNQTTWSDS